MSRKKKTLPLQEQIQQLRDGRKFLEKANSQLSKRIREMAQESDAMGAKLLNQSKHIRTLNVLLGISSVCLVLCSAVILLG